MVRGIKTPVRPPTATKQSVVVTRRQSLHTAVGPVAPAMRPALVAYGGDTAVNSNIATVVVGLRRPGHGALCWRPLHSLAPAARGDFNYRGTVRQQCVPDGT